MSDRVYRDDEIPHAGIGYTARLGCLFREGFRSAPRPRVFLAAATIGIITPLLDLSYAATILALVALAYGAAYCDPKGS